MVLAGAGVYGYGRLTEDTAGLANVWVDTTTANNTCTYSATTVAYDDTTACSTFAAAYALTASGGTVIVKCGSYDNQVFASGSSHTVMTVFRSENPLCATVQSSSAADTFLFNNGSKYITLDGFTINNGPDGYPISDTSSIGTNINTDHISLLNNNINVGVKGNGLLVSLHASQNWIIDGNTFGPSCCGATAGPSLEGIRVGKPNNATPSDCTNTACHIQITNNLFQFLNRASSTWPSSGWGSVPDVSCPLCHNDAIHFFGAQDVQINYNRFYGDECNGVFFESSGNSITSGIDIIGNAISDLANGCNGGVAFNFVGTGWAGTFNIKFNSSYPQFNLNFNSTAAFNVNVVGNYGPLNVNGSGTTACGTGTGAPNATLTFAYNVWTTSTACTGGDTASATRDWVSFDPAPAVGQDMHLSSGSAATGFVPASVTGGCPAIDFDGDTSSSPCNAGADQTVAAADGSSQAVCNGGSSPCTTGTINSYSISVDDGAGKTVSRSFKVYRPSGLANSTTNEAPLILFWGNTDSGPCPSNCDWLPLQAIADANKFVVAAVTTHGNGSPQSYAALNSIPIATAFGTGIAGVTDCGVSGLGTCDDSPLALGVLAAVECNGALPCQNIDTDRVYTMGGSKGGSMTEKMACDSTVAANFKGFVALSALVSAFGTNNTALPDCPYVRAGHHDFSFLWMYGTIDNLVYGNTTTYLTGAQTSGGRYSFAQADYPKVFMGPLLGCSTTATNSTITSGVSLALHGSCTNSTVATGLVLNTGGGHSWTGLTVNSFTPFQYAWDWLVAHYPS